MDRCALTPNIIESWARLLQIDLTPFEAEALFRIDRAYLIYHSSKK